MNTKIENFYYSCSTSQKQQLASLLIDDGLFNENTTKISRLNINDEIFLDSLNILKNRRYSLTNEQEEYINSLARKFKYI